MFKKLKESFRNYLKKVLDPERFGRWFAWLAAERSPFSTNLVLWLGGLLFGVFCVAIFVYVQQKLYILDSWRLLGYLDKLEPDVYQQIIGNDLQFQKIIGDDLQLLNKGEPTKNLDLANPLQTVIPLMRASVLIFYKKLQVQKLTFESWGVLIKAISLFRFFILSIRFNTPTGLVMTTISFFAAYVYYIDLFYTFQRTEAFNHMHTSAYVLRLFKEVQNSPNLDRTIKEKEITSPFILAYQILKDLLIKYIDTENFVAPADFDVPVDLDAPVDPVDPVDFGKFRNFEDFEDFGDNNNPQGIDSGDASNPPAVPPGNFGNFGGSPQERSMTMSDMWFIDPLSFLLNAIINYLHRDAFKILDARYVTKHFDKPEEAANAKRFFNEIMFVYKSFIAIWYYAYNQVFIRLVEFGGEQVVNLKGMIIYTTLVRRLKLYMPYLIRWHWTTIYIIHFITNKLLLVYISLDNYILKNLGISYLDQLSNLSLIHRETREDLLYARRFDSSIPLPEHETGILLKLNDLAISTMWYEIAQATIVISLVYFYAFGSLHAVSGQYYYIPIFTPNIELHIGERFEYSVYSGGHTSWQELEEIEMWKRSWHGFLGRGTDKPPVILYIYDFIKDLFTKFFRIFKR